MNRTSLIKMFDKFGVTYYHEIDCDTDDVTCRNEDGDAILTYTHNGCILDNNGAQFGKIRLAEGHVWVADIVTEDDVITFDSKHTINDVEGLLQFEVELSIMYLENKL